MGYTKLSKHVQEHLEDGELILSSVYGAYETNILGNDSLRNGILAATERRIHFYAKKVGGFDIESYPYERISSFDVSIGLGGTKYSFHAANNDVTVKWINKGQVDEFVKYVRSDAGKAAATELHAETSDIPAQITKLAELKEQGILTATKKPDLLARL